VVRLRKIRVKKVRSAFYDIGISEKFHIIKTDRALSYAGPFLIL